MSLIADGETAGWGFGENDAGRFSSVTDGDETAIRFEAPGSYSVSQQSLRLKPNSSYRLSARVKGTAGVYIRARTAQREGEDTTAYTVDSKPSDEYQELETRFPTGETGGALIIIGNTQGHGAGEVLIADLRVSRDVSYDAEGPAIPLSAGEPLTVQKVLVTDCRALRGFVVAPVDGSLRSYNWNMDVWEYGMRGAGAGVGYGYRDNDGLHITLADDKGIDAVQILGGPRVRMYAPADRYDDPGDAQLLWEFKGLAQSSRALFAERVEASGVSFFELEDGLIADSCFLRISGGAPEGQPALALGAAGASELPVEMAARFPEGQHTAYRLVPGGEATIDAPSKEPIHLLSDPLAEEMALGAVALRLAANAPTGCPLTIVLQDPLNARRELMRVDFAIGEGGELQPALDFADQIVPAGSRLWLTLTFGAPVSLDAAEVRLIEVPRGQAVPEALAYRKLLMKGIFCALSEARQWNAFNRNTDLERFYQENRWGLGVKELAETIAQCKELGPEDDTVRCFDEWFWRRLRELPPFEPEIDDIPGAPEWAVLARQAWLTSRDVPKWWIDNRLVPTGEFGGLVGDDSDMYQNYLDFPMFEAGGVAEEIKQAAAALAELAEEENLEAGLNRRTMDPLHAYEEGVNHEALMMAWNYGDPIYFERCLLAAKSMPALTVVTAKGHRHFKNQMCGAEDLRIDRELEVDGHAHPLMLHPCFEVAWYNGSPRVIQFLREWADGWLEHLQPGDYATSVDVRTDETTATGQRPLDGGYGGQSSAHNYLYWITDDISYIRPFMDFFEKGQDNWPARKFVPELWHRGALDGLAQMDSVLGGNPMTTAIALGDKSALCDALRADIAELQRFWPMYTDTEVFTDRVFLNAISNAAMCYTGGFATRNKYNRTHAVSWEGFGTDYAALVLRARRDHLKVLVHNFADAPAHGAVRLWTLDHGRYRLTLGPDADADDEADSVSRSGESELVRGDRIAIELPPRATTVLELTQLEGLDDIRDRPDLAIAAREIAIDDGALRGVVHNIGSRDVGAFDVGLLDPRGTVVETQRLGLLAAPTDLEPKRLEFSFDPIPGDVAGWSVFVDPGNDYAEIYEGNNRCTLGGDA